MARVDVGVDVEAVVQQVEVSNVEFQNLEL